MIPRRKNRPGSLPFLRAYPSRVKIATTDPAQAFAAASDVASPTPLVPNEDREDINTYWKFRARLAPREGGRNNDVTGGGFTDRGLSQDALKKLRESPTTDIWKNLPERPDQVSDSQLNGLYYWEYYKRPQVDKLARIPGLAEKAPKFAELIFDSAVQHGDDDAVRWLQTSLNRALGMDLPVDGVMGSRTREAVATALRAGKIAEVNNNIVSQRIAHMETLPNRPQNPGWIPRAGSFLMTFDPSAD